MDLGLFNVSDTYQYVLNQSGANAITLGNGNAVNWNAGGVVALTGNQSINGEKYFNNTISAPNIYINNTVSDSSLEIGGNGNVYIDLKRPNSDDYDARISTDGSSAVFSAATGPLALQTNGYNNRLLITQAGNVGIGTDSPTSTLDVRGAITNYVGTSGTQVILQNWGWNSNSIARWKPVIESNASFAFYGYDHVGGSPAPRVTIKNDNGNIGIGTSSPTSKLHLASSDTGILGGIFLENITTPKKFAISSRADLGFGARFSISDETSPAERFSISSAGNVGIGRFPAVNKLEVEGGASKTTAAAWLANSDKRIKKTINTITGALEKICKVRLVKFKYKDDYKKDHPSIEDIEYLNVIAQEFAEVFPNHVKESGEKMPDGSPILQVDIHPLTIYSAAAIQELKQIIDSQNLRISELESKLL
jgi:hypothetical protein